jgi:Tol biopolymer transport system component
MLPCASYGQVRGTFALPDSVLMFGSETSPPTTPNVELLLVSTTGTVVVQSRAGSLGQHYNALPALSPRGDRVAWGLSIRHASQGERARSVLGLYSLPDKSWKTFGDFCVDGGTGSKVISPDGERVAFPSRAASSPGGGYCFDNSLVLQILDVASGKLTPVPYGRRIDEVAQLSWSPDGKYLVGQFCCSASSAAEIVVVDLGSGKGTVIAEGMDPSWSPRGDWIAYEDKEKQKCILIHPDGTGAKVVRDLTKGFGFGHWIFFKGAVWSPDGMKIIFNEEQVDVGGQVTMLDLASSKVTKLSKKGPFVLGWARKSSARKTSD